MPSPKDVASDIYRRVRRSIISSWKVNQVSDCSNKATRHFGHGSHINSLGMSFITMYPPCDDESLIFMYSWPPLPHLFRIFSPSVIFFADIDPPIRTRCFYFGLITAAVCVMQLHSLLPLKRNVRWTHCHHPRQTNSKKYKFAKITEF